MPSALSWCAALYPLTHVMRAQSLRYEPLAECFQSVMMSKHISIPLRADGCRHCQIWPCLLSPRSSAATYTFLIAIATVFFLFFLLSVSLSLSTSCLSESHGPEDVEYRGRAVGIGEWSSCGVMSLSAQYEGSAFQHNSIDQTES